MNYKKIFLIIFVFQQNSVFYSKDSAFDEHGFFRSKIDDKAIMHTASKDFFIGMLRYNPHLSPAEAYEFERHADGYRFIDRDVQYLKNIKCTALHWPHMVVGHLQPNVRQVRDSKKYDEEIYRCEIAMLQALLPNNPEVIEDMKRYHRDTLDKNAMYFVQARNKPAELNLQNPKNFASYDLQHKDPLFEDIKQGNIQILSEKLSQGLSVDTCDHLGVSLLSTAIRYNQSKIVDMLCQQGVDVNRPDKTGWLPVLVAAMYGHQTLQETLCNKGARIDVPSGYRNLFPSAFRSRNPYIFQRAEDEN